MRALLLSSGPWSRKKKKKVDEVLADKSGTASLHTSASSSSPGREHLQCLRPGGELNDVVIYSFLKRLQARATRARRKLWCLDTHFWPMLCSGATGYDYETVKTWSVRAKVRCSTSICSWSP